MTFEELNKLITAIRADRVSFNFIDRSLDMLITPEYGVNEGMKGKKFHLKFENCAYFGGVNLGKLDSNGGTEFISWGEIKEKENILPLYNYTAGGPALLSQPELSKLLSSSSQYFFENAFGDTLRVACSKVTVSEV